ncbi:unnamed protein product [Dovyalis caffra]|uniref:Pentatricopeptide repeat-containing protein n=1 Tax=Dovyalis caffra TaxID=77055 RepID=A0AAV1QTZ4_9ROSI|nr:unnamed protein product [Dovyalis caffra]
MIYVQWDEGEECLLLDHYDFRACKKRQVQASIEFVRSNEESPCGIGPGGISGSLDSMCRTFGGFDVREVDSLVYSKDLCWFKPAGVGFFEQCTYIHVYASCGMIEEAYEIFRWMPEKNTISWTSLITAFAKRGYAQEALQVFHLMQTVGTMEERPDAITFIAVLSACSHAGLDMIQCWRIKPRIEHYGCVVDLLSRAGFLDEARDLIETMPKKPNDAVWGALLGGCRIHSNSELASHVSQKLMVERDSDKAARYLSHLAHVSGTAEKWQDAATVREKMVSIGAKTHAGRSWIQINEGIRDFVANDRTHKNASSIYEMLRMITWQAKLEGYKPDISKVLQRRSQSTNL